MFVNSEGLCVCEPTNWIANGDGCIEKSEYAELDQGGWIDSEAYKTVFYRRVATLVGEVEEISQTSDLFDYFYLQAATGCKFDSNPQDCQVLANLCVLQQYSEISKACKMFRSIQATRQPSQRVEFYGDEGWKKQIPWLYYEKETGETLRGEPVPNLVASFTRKDTSNKARTDALTYYLARYAMDGTFMGFTELKDQLSLCPLTFDEVKKMRKFGVVSEVSCDIELSQLAVKLDSLQLSSEANTFFELYLSDYEGNLIDVPVLMETFQDSEEEFPNLKFDIDKNRLVHRFFLFDTISGI